MTWTRMSCKSCQGRQVHLTSKVLAGNDIAQKRRAMTIVEEHGGNAWGVECCVKLSQVLKVPMKDLLCFGGSITSRAWIGGGRTGSDGSGFCGVGC
jgi:hypothetical protein